MHSRLAALLLAGGLGCEAPASPCPPGTAADPARVQALVAAVRGTQAGAGRTFEATTCFGGEVRGTVRPDGVVVLASSLGERAAAARLLHMHMHVHEGLHRFPAAGVACERQVESAIAAEARGIVAEIAACAELGCEAAPYSFAPRVLAAAPGEREAIVRAALLAAPATDGLDVLVADYRRRCERGG